MANLPPPKAESLAGRLLEQLAVPVGKPRRIPLAGCSSWKLEGQPKKDLVSRLSKELRFWKRAAFFAPCAGLSA